MARDLSSSLRGVRLAPVVLVLLVIGELAVIQISRHLFDFECFRESYAFCGWARNLLLASYSLAAVGALVVVLARSRVSALLAETGPRRLPLLINLAGLTLLVASLPFLRRDLSDLALAGLTVAWGIGVSALVGGLLAMIAPFARWRRFARDMGWGLPVMIVAGALAPFAALQIRPMWRADALSEPTFAVVVRLLHLWGTEVETDPANKIIGARDFYIDIAPSCSGIEGIVLTLLFVTIYLTMFRRELRFPAALLLLPIAVAISWMLNGLRIAVLVQIGLSGHPELAVGAFHSHAGWLMFTILSLGIVLVSQGLGLFRRRDAAVQTRTLPPFFADPQVARILPFALFMGTALLASTFASNPGVIYPFRVLILGAGMALFLPFYRGLNWRLDPLAAGSGAAVGVLWVLGAMASDASGAPPYGALSGAALIGWALLRGLGTIVLVPVVEELFFRGYLERRLAFINGPAGVFLGIALSSAAFAVLHDKWLMAFGAALVFSFVWRRSGNIADAIIAHAVANAVVFAVAAATGNYHLI